MLQLREAILRTFFETGTTTAQVSPIRLVQENYPGTSAKAVASELTVLAAQGLIRLTAKDGAVITAAGLRKAQELHADPSASYTENIVAPSITTKHDSKPVEPPADNTELELDEILDLLSTGSEHQTPTDGLDIMVNDADVFELEEAIDEFSEDATADVPRENGQSQEPFLDKIIQLAKDLRFQITTMSIESEEDRKKCSEMVDGIMTNANLLKKNSSSS